MCGLEEVEKLCRKEGHIIKPGTPKYKTMEHRTPVEHQNTDGTIRIPKNGET